VSEISERDVRRRAGWIGVEISKSRVRTPGKAGYGLYRVRLAPYQHKDAYGYPAVTEGEWTAYAFTLDAIYLAVRNSIEGGTPTGPLTLMVERDGWAPGDGLPYVTLPTRWTHRYQGRRDLGVAPSLGETPHEADGCHMEGRPHLGPCCGPGVPEAERGHAPRCLCPRCVKFRQREYNAAFQAEHAVRRGHGLKARHAGRGRDA
jgi:hypothetical protein